MVINSWYGCDYPVENVHPLHSLLSLHMQKKTEDSWIKMNKRTGSVTQGNFKDSSFHKLTSAFNFDLASCFLHAAACMTNRFITS